jgi:sterol desaturase/sphingolipid hydroxylase (fatty acid hydroxylase superfamily)
VNNLMKIRLGVFFGVLLVCAAAERLRPRRVRASDTGPRSLVNLGLGALGALSARLLVPFALIEVAYKAEGMRFGLLNALPISVPVNFVLSMILLDLAIYCQHRLLHLPALWRIHAVHHTDLDLDASSGVRFHPGEIVLSAFFKIAVVALLGAHFLAVVFFEVILNATSLFTHSNLDLGLLDAPLRPFVVTPDMHRVHHSPTRDETDSNFGFNLSLWDRLFGTYRAQPREPHATMTLGLGDRAEPGLLSALARPFRSVA